MTYKFANELEPGERVMGVLGQKPFAGTRKVKEVETRYIVRFGGSEIEVGASDQLVLAEPEPE